MHFEYSPVSYWMRRQQLAASQPARKRLLRTTRSHLHLWVGSGGGGGADPLSPPRVSSLGSLYISGVGNRRVACKCVLISFFVLVRSVFFCLNGFCFRKYRIKISNDYCRTRSLLMRWKFKFFFLIVCVHYISNYRWSKIQVSENSGS